MTARAHAKRGGARAAATDWDVVVVGAGIMGSACAWKLAEAGQRVVVLEKSVPGAEASSAAAGILGAGAEAHGPGPMADLLAAGLTRHPAWAARLRRVTGIDVELRRCGVLTVADSRKTLARLTRETAWMSATGRRRERLDARTVAQFEPALAPTAGAIRFPDDARIDPRLLFRAVHVAAVAAGVQFVTGQAVQRIVIEDGRARGVAIEGGATVRGRQVIVAAGSWSTLVPGTPLPANAVTPARGQMVQLETRAPPLRHVIVGPRCYLVPRDDGRVLVGATVEFVGYRREVTARAIRDLLDAAIELAPCLADAAFGTAWSSFRPYTRDEMPLLGRTSVPDLLLATGHHRNGVLLAPITAEIVTAIALGKRPRIDASPFESARLVGTGRG